MNRKGNAIVWLMVGVLVVILLVSMILFFTRDVAEEYVPSFGFTLDTCSFVTENYDCLGRDVFERGESIWTVLKVSDLKSNKGKVHFIQDRKVMGPDGVIKEVSGIIMEKELSVKGNGYYVVPIKNEITTSSDDIVGEYVITMEITDVNTGQKRKKSEKVELK